jgi:hypothetical protein
MLIHRPALPAVRVRVSPPGPLRQEQHFAVLALRAGGGAAGHLTADAARGEDTVRELLPLDYLPHPLQQLPLAAAVAEEGEVVVAPEPVREGVEGLHLSLSGIGPANTLPQEVAHRISAGADCYSMRFSCYGQQLVVDGGSLPLGWRSNGFSRCQDTSGRVGAAGAAFLVGEAAGRWRGGRGPSQADPAAAGFSGVAPSRHRTRPCGQRRRKHLTRNELPSKHANIVIFAKPA